MGQGKRRQSNWYSLSGSQLANTLASLEQTVLTLGYTGHEQDDEVGLINMKGRLYDPEIGRFISADPHVQAAGDTQSYNRYSYVKNNPLVRLPDSRSLGGRPKCLPTVLQEEA